MQLFRLRCLKKKLRAVSIYTMSEVFKYNNPHNWISGIYRIVAPTGHYYLGSTKDFRKRYKQHIEELKGGRHPNHHMQNRFAKYPLDWVFECIEHVTTSNLLQTEQRYLDNSIGSYLCMNSNPIACKPPSQKGKKQSSETIAKRTAKVLGQKRAACTDEHRQKISVAHKNSGHTFPSRKGITLSQEHKDKIRNSNLGKKRTAETISKIKSRIITEETRRKIGNKSRGHVLSPISVAKRQLLRWIRGHVTTVNIPRAVVHNIINDTTLNTEYLDAALAYVAY